MDVGKVTKSLPPFGKIVVNYIDALTYLPWHITIYVGDNAYHHAVEELRLKSVSMYLPKNKNYDEFSWPVHNQDIILIGDQTFELETLFEFAYALKMAGARQVVVYDDRLDHAEMINE